MTEAYSTVARVLTNAIAPQYVHTARLSMNPSTREPELSFFVPNMTGDPTAHCKVQLKLSGTTQRKHGSCWHYKSGAASFIRPAVLHTPQTKQHVIDAALYMAGYRSSTPETLSVEERGQAETLATQIRDADRTHIEGGDTVKFRHGTATLTGIVNAPAREGLFEVFLRDRNGLLDMQEPLYVKSENIIEEVTRTTQELP